MDEHTLNDILECSVCLERLDDAKVLPCQHTFCRKCLEVIVSNKNELLCPECRIVVHVKIDDLPPNVLLMRILEGMKNTDSKTQIAQNDIAIPQNESNETNEALNTNIENITNLLKKDILNADQHNQRQLKQLKQSNQHQTANQANTTDSLLNSSTTTPQRRYLIPHAFALHDFESNVPTDLTFKKGDVILLKGRIDNNWYIGRRNGFEGSFPINYVQTVIPLPTPQCIALYDFKMGPNEEEGCLSFKKDTVIHVLRRVDANWAEGRIGDNIGIFPIAFVEVNALAKELLENFSHNMRTNLVNTQQSNIVTTILTQQQQKAKARNVPTLPVTNTTQNINPCDSTSSSSTSSHNNSPNSTTCSSNSSSNSISSSPKQSLPNTPQHSSNSVIYRKSKEKRHSLNALLFNNGTDAATNATANTLQTHRHSAEILSIPNEVSLAATAALTASVGNGLHSLRLRNTNFNTEFATNSNAAVSQQTTVPREQKQQTNTNNLNQRTSILKSNISQYVPPALPCTYMALYNYKPRMEDELELNRDCVYLVTERCPDGWYKGRNWLNKSGVFPGNYVTPLKYLDQQQINHKLYTKPAQQHNATTANNYFIQTKSANKFDYPPDLPQRTFNMEQAAPAAAVSSASAWNKPITQTIEHIFNRSGNSNSKTQQTLNKDNKEQEKTNANVNANTTNSSAAASLMKRLTQIKSRSKSPNTLSNTKIPNANFQQNGNAITSAKDNFNFSLNSQANNAQTTTTQLHPVHVRSGSCPSQLLQSAPVVENAKNKQQQQKQQYNQYMSTQPTYGSQRIKGSKERTSLPNTRQSIDWVFRDMFNHATSQHHLQQQQLQQEQQQKFQQQLQQQFVQHQHQQHKPQQSQVPHNLHEPHVFKQQLEQIQQQMQMNAAAQNAVYHRKADSLDAKSFNTPLTRAHGGGGGGGNGYANLATTKNDYISFNATKKSAQNLLGCRVRCVVPFPPNSDIELELHTGDIIYVEQMQQNGWYKGTHARTNKVGIFPASFVEPDV